MKIAFIRPNIFECRSHDAMEPLVFAILAARTPPGIDLVLYDERVAPIPFDDEVSLVAMTVETYTAKRAYQIANRFRQQGVPVVMGGYHPTFLPDEALQYCDAVVVGDAEEVWQRILADFKAGKLKKIYRGDDNAPLSGVSLDRRIFGGKSYAPMHIVQYGRGCRYNCDFCSIRAFYGSNLRQRPVSEVVAEIEALDHKRIFFADDNIFVDTAKAKELLTALVPLRITWTCQVSIDIVRDKELMKLLERSGCVGVLVGFESLNPANLQQMKKGWNLKWLDYESSIAILQDAGLMIYGTFVFGYDGDTVDSFDETVEFAIRNKFTLANFNPLTPTPATPLFDRLKREGRLLHDKWWLDDNYRYGEATFRPQNMTPQELTDGCYRARTTFNSYSSIFGRLLNVRTNFQNLSRAGFHLALNLRSRREIHTKNGRLLGSSIGTSGQEMPACI